MKNIIINSNDSKVDVIVIENDKVVEKYQENIDKKSNEGNIYLAKVVDVLPGMQAAFVDIGEEKNAFLHIKDVIPKANNITGNKNEKLSKSNITNFVKVGMPVVVQVKKDKVETKGPRVSLDLNIAGRYSALITNSHFITVSNKITTQDEIDRLKNIFKNQTLEKYGWIIRTAANQKSDELILKDIQSVEKIYNNIIDKKEQLIKNSEIPSKIYDAGGIVNKVVLGLIEEVDSIIVNNKSIYDSLKIAFSDIEKIMIFDEKYELSSIIQKQIDKLTNRKIWLNCGGFITIDKTEALTAIDVNTGKYIGKESLENTVLKVNSEATVEIAKQIRARDIGGIIIIDYIDMEENESEEQIIKLLEKELKKDRAKTQIIGFTPLHLLEMTRKHLCTN